ncbi:hypothetical protein F5Y08DRAFT_322250 [Xylaria arbuscula]|nr:hypothetical protein F5Y08DRAFT_322250 [Xylaria arbuscula]
MKGFTVQRELSVKDCIGLIRTFVKAEAKKRGYALLLIASCSWYLAKKSESINESDQKLTQLKDAAETHLRELESGCPDSRRILWGKLNYEVLKSSDIYPLRMLLKELTRPVKVLLMSADPKGTTPTDSDEERRELSGALGEADYGHRIIVQDRHGCRADDILGALNHHQPDILHFLGHGDKKGLYFKDRNNQPELVPMASFADVLKQCKTIKLVILGTCYSQHEGQCIADAVGYCIGIEGVVRNRDAIAFTRKFYTALGGGFEIERSFDQANVHVRLDKEAKLQAHLLRRGCPPHITKVSARTPTGRTTGESRGPLTSTTQWTVTYLLILMVCVLGTAVYFQNVCLPAESTVTLRPGLQNLSGRVYSSSMWLKPPMG